MSRPCPIYGKAIYADCLECETKDCRCVRKHGIKISKGDIIKAESKYFIYCGIDSNKRILFDVLNKKRIYVNSNYFSKYKEAEKV